MDDHPHIQKFCYCILGIIRQIKRLNNDGFAQASESKALNKLIFLFLVAA